MYSLSIGIRGLKWLIDNTPIHQIQSVIIIINNMEVINKLETIILKKPIQFNIKEFDRFFEIQETIKTLKTSIKFTIHWQRSHTYQVGLFTILNRRVDSLSHISTIKYTSQEHTTTDFHQQSLDMLFWGQFLIHSNTKSTINKILYQINIIKFFLRKFQMSKSEYKQLLNSHRILAFRHKYPKELKMIHKITYNWSPINTRNHQ